MYEETITGLRTIVRNFKGRLPPHARVTIAQAADAIKELQNTYDTVTSVQKHVIENLRNDLDFAIRAEAAAVKACTPRWISVEEKLPEKYEQVLAYGKHGFLVDNYIGEFDGSILFSTATYHITHWMPLPEPPKEDKP